MIIVGLTGGISHGKTTFAELLGARGKSARHLETWELVAEVAHALRVENPLHPATDDLEAINRWLFPLSDIVRQFMHVDISYEAIKVTQKRVDEQPDHYIKLFEYLALIGARPDLAGVEITPELKQTFRPLLQWLGGFLVHNGGNGIWYDEILRRAGLLQATGCDLLTVGGVRFPADAERLRNAGAVIIEIRRPDLPLQDSQDITERERDLIEPDSLIINNGNLTDLATCAAQVYKDICRRNLAPQYKSITN